MAHIATGFCPPDASPSIYACTLPPQWGGATNMITPAAATRRLTVFTAFAAGRVYASRQPDPVLQQVEQEHDLTLSTNDAFRAVSRYWGSHYASERMKAPVSARCGC
ncbi:hypothetical protein KCP75_23555 [Salmonella enterica subsp. enterica]|nr:hypothetical protein KCP75_23555 [Salmonella enterica subsp. enterica]